MHLLAHLFQSRKSDPGQELLRRRKANLLKFATADSQILEIGPSFGPVAPRREGWKTWIVDHASTSELIEKYQTHDVSVEGIEEVNSVWNSNRLEESIPDEKHGIFDVLIASHVIEHMPDLVSFLISARMILRPSGKISLAIPDKRYCFDYYKPLTMTGDLLAAHQSGAVRHNPRTVFNNFAYAVTLDSWIMWGQHPVKTLEFKHSLEASAHLAEGANQEEQAPYLDCHAWHFMPSNFQLVILELAQLALIDWSIESLSPSDGCEFIVHLKRGRQHFQDEAEFNAARLRLLDLMLDETEEQIRYARLGRQMQTKNIRWRDKLRALRKT